MVKKIPQKYETSDGRVFESKEAAELHEKLVTAKADYEQARTKYAAALAETQFTADGHPFSLHTLRYYYYISPGYFGRPELQEVSFYLWNCDLDDNDETVIAQYETRGDQKRRVEYKISELYRSRNNARFALVAAQEKWLDTVAREVAKLHDEVCSDK